MSVSDWYTDKFGNKARTVKAYDRLKQERRPKPPSPEAVAASHCASAPNKQQPRRGFDPPRPERQSPTQLGQQRLPSGPRWYPRGQARPTANG